MVQRKAESPFTSGHRDLEDVGFNFTALVPSSDCILTSSSEGMAEDGGTVYMNSGLWHRGFEGRKRRLTSCMEIHGIQEVCHILPRRITDLLSPGKILQVKERLLTLLEEFLSKDYLIEELKALGIANGVIESY